MCKVQVSVTMVGGATNSGYQCDAILDLRCCQYRAGIQTQDFLPGFSATCCLFIKQYSQIQLSFLSNSDLQHS